MINWKQCERNRPWSNLRYPSICLEALRKNTKTLGIAGLRTMDVMIHEQSGNIGTSEYCPTTNTCYCHQTLRI
jgi:hypothetical protein